MASPPAHVVDVGLIDTSSPPRLVLTAVAVVLGLITMAALAVVADRTARATAWRQIALERRWNHDQRQ